MEDFDGSKDPTKIVFSFEVFWIQVCNMPLGSMSRDIGLQVGAGIGKVLKIETDESSCAWGPFYV